MILRSQRPNERVIIDTRIDTVILKETIRDTILIPKAVYISRIDTVFFESPGDTVRIPIPVPITQKTYQTDSYKAVIEGFKPSLIEMEVYQETKYITEQITKTIRKKPKFSVGVGVSGVYDLKHQTFGPALSVGLHYNLITF